MLSINGDQERQDIPDFFQERPWPPTADDLAEFNAAMSVDDDMVLRELRRLGLAELARMQSQSTTVPDVVLGDTYNTWFKGWPAKAPHDLIGDNPEAAFFGATTVPLPEFISLGMWLWQHTKNGDVNFTTASIDESVEASAIDLCATVHRLASTNIGKGLHENVRRDSWLIAVTHLPSARCCESATTSTSRYDQPGCSIASAVLNCTGRRFSILAPKRIRAVSSSARR